MQGRTWIDFFKLFLKRIPSAIANQCDCHNESKKHIWVIIVICSLCLKPSRRPQCTSKSHFTYLAHWHSKILIVVQMIGKSSSSQKKKPSNYLYSIRHIVLNWNKFSIKLSLIREVQKSLGLEIICANSTRAQLCSKSFQML